jgi:hypothetical protein
VIAIGIIGNWSYTSGQIENQLFKRTREINKYGLETVVAERGSQVSMDIIHQVLDRYSTTK